MWGEDKPVSMLLFVVLAIIAIAIIIIMALVLPITGGLVGKLLAFAKG